MKRSVEFRLSYVSPILCARIYNLTAPDHEIEVNLGELFLHYYFDRSASEHRLRNPRDRTWEPPGIWIYAAGSLIQRSDRADRN